MYGLHDKAYTCVVVVSLLVDLSIQISTDYTMYMPNNTEEPFNVL